VDLTSHYLGLRLAHPFVAGASPIGLTLDGVKRLGDGRAAAIRTSAELRRRLMRVAVLYDRGRASPAVTGGVATPADGIKAHVAGAGAVQIVSAALRHGASCVRTLRDGLQRGMDSTHVSAIGDIRGRLSVAAGVDVDRWTRAHYIRMLQSWTADR
jgi:hypothetical protein